MRVEDPDVPEADPEIAVYCARCFSLEFNGLRLWLEPGRPD